MGILPLFAVPRDFDPYSDRISKEIDLLTTPFHFLREPDAANPHVRFDERDVETEHHVPPRHVSTLLRCIPRVQPRSGDRF